MRIVSRDAFAQRRQSRLQRITILLLLNHAHRLAHNHVRRRQIRLPEPETDTARLGPIRNLSDHALFNAAKEWWWLKPFHRLILHPMGLGRSAVSPKPHERMADRKQWVATKMRLDHL